MAAYGFRVYSIRPRVRRTQKFLRVEDVSSASSHVDSVDAMYAAARELEGKLKLGDPVYFSTPDEEELRIAALAEGVNLPYFIIQLVQREDRVLKFLIETGRESDHDALRGRDGTAESMKDRAATRRFAVFMIFPEAGDYAFLVAETRGRSQAAESLMRWLDTTAQRDAVSVTEDNKRDEGAWLNWKIEPRIDGARLDGILNKSSDYAIRLRRQMITSSGTRGSYDIELVQLGLKQTPIEKVLNVINAMWERRGKGSEPDRRSKAASDVLTLIEPNVSGVNFTDGEISFKENGKVQTINAETVDRLFVYPIGEKRPSADDILGRGQAVIAQIATTLKVEVSSSDES